MPADITGTNILVEDPQGGRQFAFQPGPVFANLVLADEINRATPKTQSALLEAMAEKTVTVANEIHLLDEPFFVLATQNPLEMEGTYPLPEAQLDRFFFKLVVPYPSGEDLTEIVRRTTAPAMPEAAKVADGAVIRQMGLLSRQVPIASSVTDYVVRMTLATHPENADAPDVVRRYVRYGVSPRGAQAIVLGSKIRALIEGRLNVAYDDVRAVAAPALRHRLILNFDAESSGVTADDVLGQLIAIASGPMKLRRERVGQRPLLQHCPSTRTDAGAMFGTVAQFVDSTDRRLVCSDVLEAWCSGLTCSPVKAEIAGSNPVASASSISRLTPPDPSGVFPCPPFSRRSRSTKNGAKSGCGTTATTRSSLISMLCEDEPRQLIALLWRRGCPCRREVAKKRRGLRQRGRPLRGPRAAP